MNNTNHDSTIGSQKNIILLSIDALRADHISYHGYGRDTTPFFNSIQDQVITFSNAISASSHTREAIPSMITGHHPSEFADNGYRLVKDSLAARLSNRNYSTAAFHSNPYVSRAYDYDTNFDTFDDDLLLGQNRLLALIQRALDKFVLKKGKYHARADQINSKSLEWLDSLDDGPFFLWNHYMDTHGPYNPPAGYNIYQKSINNPEAITDSERKLLLDLYDGEIRYLDTQLENFLSAIEDRGLRENSLIIITADHGDAFGEFGYFTHPREVHDFLLHVPLLILPPGDQGADIDTVVSTLDIVPTLLQWIDEPSDSLPGQVLYSEGETLVEDHPGVAFAGAQGIDEDEGQRLFSARDKKWQLIIEREIKSGDILNRSLFSVENDFEEKEWGDVNSERVDSLYQDLLDESGRQLAVMTGSSETEESVDDEINDRLEALGYK